MTRFTLVAGDDPRLASSSDAAVAVRCLETAELDGADAHRHRADVLAFVAENPDAPSRTNTVGHLTGSALVVDPSRGRTLLMLHRKLGRWFQPGGHADGDTNLAAVARREASEETGIDGLQVVLPAFDIDVHQVDPPKEAAHLHLDVRYLVIAPDGAAEHGNEESLALRWVDVDDLDDLEPPIDPGTRRLVERGLAISSALVR